MEKEAKKRAEKFKSLKDYDSKLTFSSLQYEKDLFTQDSVLREKRDRWHKDLARDIYVEEAVNVLKDLHKNNIKKEDDKLASVNKG